MSAFDDFRSLANSGFDGAWYADAGASGARALGLQHVPALVAVERGRIAWVVTGVLNDPAAVEPIVRNWTAR